MEEESPKVVLLGNEGVGKTTLFYRFKERKNVEVDQRTRFTAEHKREWTIGSQAVKVRPCCHRYSE